MFPIRTFACALLAVGLAGPAAAAADGTRATGGTAVPSGPKVRSARCVDGSTWRCAPGKKLTLGGEDLAKASSVVFIGEAGKADDRRVRPKASAAHALSVTVPKGAVTGPLRVRTAAGVSETSRPVHIRSAASATPETETPETETPAKLFAGGRSPASFRYRVAGSPPEGAAIEVVRVSDGRVIARRPLASSDQGTARWNGLVDGTAVPTGRYAFRVSDGAEGAVTPEQGQATEFTVYDHMFPIRGRHDLGQSATNNFGGGRNHQGQDMFAACGTPLAAVTNAEVTYAGYQGAAGNYVVLRRADGESYAYMHMRDPALVRTGDRVYTGQRIGVVGESGRATGCHLHFELWTAPGWYAGGRAVDPLPSLRRWDRWS